MTNDPPCLISLNAKSGIWNAECNVRMQNLMDDMSATNGVIFFPMENPFLTHLSEHPYRRTGS